MTYSYLILLLDNRLKNSMYIIKSFDPGYHIDLNNNRVNYWLFGSLNQKHPTFINDAIIEEVAVDEDPPHQKKMINP